MTAYDHLEKAYEDWRRCTQNEGRALAAGDWIAVARYQSAKADLQPLILQLTDAVNSESQVLSSVEAGRQKIRQLINELIELERANNNLLEEQRTKAVCRKSELMSSRRNLGRMHRSYTNARPSLWQSYS